MKNLICLFSVMFLTLFNALLSQELVKKIEILTIMNVGPKSGKIARKLIVQDGFVFKQKRFRLVRLGSSDSLDLILKRNIIDSIIRNDISNCDEFYEASIHLKFYTATKKMLATYTYTFSIPVSCVNASSSNYLRRILDESNRLSKLR